MNFLVQPNTVLTDGFSCDCFLGSRCASNSGDTCGAINVPVCPSRCSTRNSCDCYKPTQMRDTIN